MSLETLTTFFGWMTVVHFVILTIATLAMFLMRDWATGLHAKLFDLEEQQVRQTFYSWLATYKLLIFVFALVPWLALHIM
ncbi:DUF6868 family protein [Shimia sp.]|uniref:DUF6868 family protein n=1 Tax=Shimia sp. TaxID=1954381 RepID=UPI003297FEA8